MVVCFIVVRSPFLSGYIIEAVVKALKADVYPLYTEWCSCPVTGEQWYQQFVVIVNLKHVSHAIKVYLIGEDTPLHSFGFLL